MAAVESPVTPQPLELDSEKESTYRLGSNVRVAYRLLTRVLLICLLLLLVSFVLFWWGPSAKQGNAATEEMAVSRTTAMSSGLAAEPIARKWATDARLISLSAIWDGGKQFQGGEGDWSLLYYSLEEAATALISVHDGHATMIVDRGVTEPIMLNTENQWQIDSPVVVEQLLAAGGDDFLRTQPRATVSMSLDLTGDAVWRVRLIDQMTRRVFAAHVSIDDGEIVAIEQSG